MSTKLTCNSAGKLYDNLSDKKKAKLSSRFGKALLCKENIDKYCDEVSFPVDSIEGTQDEIVSFVEENTKRLTESSTKFVSSSKEYYKNTLAFASLKGMKNAVFNKEYNNQASQREDLINALSIIDCHLSLNDYVNDTIESVDDENKKVPVILDNVQQSANQKALEDIKPNADDDKKAKKAAKMIQRKKALFPTIMMWLFLLATAGAAGYVYFHRELYPFIGLCAAAGLFLIFFIATIAVSRRYSQKVLKKALLECWTKKWQSYVEETGAAARTISSKREQLTQWYNSALSEWEKNKVSIKDLLEKFNKQLSAIDKDFLRSIPEEYRTLKDIRQIINYLRSYRTNTLSDTYEFIERKRKEELKEAEDREYKEKQLAIERMNASIAQKSVELTKLQEEYSKLNTGDKK